MGFYLHESSYVDTNVKIGEGTKIWFFSHIQNGAELGNNCSIGQNVNIGQNVKIGNGVKVQIMFPYMRELYWKIMFFVGLLWYLQMT